MKTEEQSLSYHPLSSLVGATTTDLLLQIFPSWQVRNSVKLQHPHGPGKWQLPIPVWTTHVRQHFLDKSVAIFQMHLIHILHSQNIILNCSTTRTTEMTFTDRLQQVSALSWGFKDTKTVSLLGLYLTQQNKAPPTTSPVIILSSPPLSCFFEYLLHQWTSTNLFF